MPGSRRMLGGPVAPRPFVEKVRIPLYDSVLVSNGNRENRLFVNPIGVADTNAINGATKTYIDTNMQQGTSLPTPKSFDIEGISLKFQADVTRTNLNAFLTTSHLKLNVGEKTYLAVPFYTIPGDVGLEGNHIRADGTGTFVLSLHNGIGMHKNIYDLQIPEEVVDPASGRGAWTGRSVPIHLPSNQQFSVDIVHPGGIVITSGTTERIYVYLWGELKREVH